MTQFEAFSLDVEVNGSAILAFVAGMGSHKSYGLKVLEEHGIKFPKVGLWYSQKAFLDSLKEISEKVGGKTLRIIGQHIPKNAIFPSDINSVEKGLASIDVAYNTNHRGGEIGNYKFEKTGSSSATVKCYNPYPCEFDRGIIDSMVKKFQTEDNMAVIRHLPGSCKKNGDEYCTFSVKW